VSWSGAGGVTRTTRDQVLAWLLRRAAHLTATTDLRTTDVVLGTGPSLLRGLSALAYPDAGSPGAEVDADRRWFLDWVLGEVAAQP
jgi:hypothetical protein